MTIFWRALMKFLILFCTLCLTSTSFAQNRQPRFAQERQAQRLVDQIANLAPRSLSTLSQRELDTLLFQLTDARNTLLAIRNPAPLPPTRPNPRPNPRPYPRDEVQLSCTSRDNDNLRPFVLSYVDTNFTVVKLRDVTFSSMQSCEESLNNRRYMLGATLSCTSRDGDDVPPFAMIKFMNSQVSKLANQRFSSLSSCFSVLEQSRVLNQDEIAFCIDRDADNVAPFVMKKLNVASGTFSQLNTNSFPNMEECLRVLQSR